jgi:hypothetical protein
MMDDYARNHLGCYRPSRVLVFCLGIALGIIVSFGAYGLKYLAAGVGDSTDSWDNQSIVCAGELEGVFYIQNRSTTDYTIIPEKFKVYSKTAMGLTPSNSKLNTPVTVPRGDTVGLTFDPPLQGGGVVFDFQNHYRIELGGAEWIADCKSRNIIPVA